MSWYKDLPASMHDAAKKFDSEEEFLKHAESQKQDSDKREAAQSSAKKLEEQLQSQLKSLQDIEKSVKFSQKFDNKTVEDVTEKIAKATGVKLDEVKEKYGDLLQSESSMEVLKNLSFGERQEDPKEPPKSDKEDESPKSLDELQDGIDSIMNNAGSAYYNPSDKDYDATRKKVLKMIYEKNVLEENKKRKSLIKF